MVQTMKDEDSGAKVLTCGSCRRTGGFSQPISVVLVFAPGLERPYPLIPAEEYQVCTRCDAIFAFIDRATSMHPVVSEAGLWTRAIVIFSDGAGLDVAAKREQSARPTQKMAMA